MRQRKTNRLKEYDYSLPGEYFVTICKQTHECLFGAVKNGEMRLNKLGETVEDCWIEIPKQYQHVNLDEYIIMPNHIHGIIVICDTDICRGEVTSPLRKGNTISPIRKPTLGQIVAYFKYHSTKMMNELYWLPGAKIWQRNYYDRIIRDGRELQNIREYIRNNAVVWAFQRENHQLLSLFQHNNK